MRVALISFTSRGAETADRIAEVLRAEGHEASCACGSGSGKVDRMAWAAEEFARCDALVFVGAAGIAVRTVAPLLESKLTDPAVLVIDEACGHCVPLLSGHVGGANELAGVISALVGATPVITTATDIAGAFAIDSWAISQGLVIANPERIKRVSGKLLAGESIACFSEFPIMGELPAGVEMVPFPDGADVRVGIRGAASEALRLVPRVAVLGIGCRRGTPSDVLSEAIDAFLDEHQVEPEAVCMMTSIDLKAGEPGLLQLAIERGWGFETFTADELNAASGAFASSSFVNEVTGTDNVCERSVAATGASILVHKTVVDGVTLSLGASSPTLSWA